MENAERGDLLDPWVYVPAHPVITGGDELAEYERRELADGNPALPAFTSVGALTAQLGACQPWLRMRISEVIRAMGPDHVAVDPVVDPAAWRWDSGHLKEFADALRADRCGGKP